MDKKNGVEKLNIKPGCLKRMIAGALALITVFPVVGCRNEKSNGGDYGIENSPSSFSDSHDKSSSEKEASSSRKDSSSRESSNVNSQNDVDYVLEDDSLDHHPDITPEDYIAVVTEGPIVSTDERISTTTTVKGGRTSSSSSNLDKFNEKINSGTSARRGGVGVGIASVDDGKNNKIPRESTPVNTTARVKVTTTRAPRTTTTTTTTTTAPVTTTTPEPAPIVTEPYNQIADVTDLSGNDYQTVDQVYDNSSFVALCKRLTKELKIEYPNPMKQRLDFGYGETTLRVEAAYMVQLFNMDYFSYYDTIVDANSMEWFDKAKFFLYNFDGIQGVLLNNEVKLSDCIVDPFVGDFVDGAKRASNEGNFSQYIEQKKLENGGVLPSQILNNAGAMAILYSCGNDSFDFETVDATVNDAMNCISNQVAGYSYFPSKQR